jgi:hypothetical protein
LRPLTAASSAWSGAEERAGLAGSWTAQRSTGPAGTGGRETA